MVNELSKETVASVKEAVRNFSSLKAKEKEKKVKKVWILIDNGIDTAPQQHLHGVFTTKKKAGAAMTELYATGNYMKADEQLDLSIHDDNTSLPNLMIYAVESNAIYK